ncbi:PEP-CTERM putative exosortase interaction domain-containing protein [Burkholderiales bacterium JOSHI_001]|nr:PEP-CTERM putative exosortase interaction domain-containing protein [Burkholderiales bacterium JOSHI_001]
MMNKLLAAALLACAFTTAQAVPSLAITGQLAGQDNAAYTGTLAIGAGSVNDPNTLFFVQEQQVGNVQSWVFFADPAVLTRFTATLTFGAPILAVYTTRTELVNSGATYGVDVDHDGVFNDYAKNANMALEVNDLVTYTPGGNTLSLDWQVQAASDMMRVVTAVPEPGSLALLALGLLAMGLKLGRRRG